MTFNDKQLREIEINERWLARFESPRPDAGLVARVKGAAHHAADEIWLAGSRAPRPDARKLVDVKAAVRAELAADAGRGVSIRTGSRLYRLAVALSSAAMIALAVGALHFAQTGRGPRVVAAVDPGELFLEALDAVLEDSEPQLQVIEEALSTMESASGSYLGQNGDLDDIDEQIDALWAESYDVFETS